MESKRPRSIQQLEQALREKTREAGVLHRISESISSTLDLEAVLRHIVEVVVEVTKAEACLLYLLSESRDELTLLSTIANQVGGAIENARLYEEMKRKALQLDTLSQVSETVASNRLIEDIFQLIVAMTAQMMNSKICSIMLLDPPTGELRIVATQSLSEQYRRKPNLKVGQSISGRALQERRPIIVPDVTGEREYMYPEIAKKEGLCSLLSVPMMIRDKAVGVINSYTSVPHAFTHEEVKIMQAIANQAAIAIEHTTLLEKSFEMQEALAVRKLVERAKGYLMRSKKLSEEEAFRLIQRQSMDLRKSMREIAEAILLAGEIAERAERNRV